MVVSYYSDFGPSLLWYSYPPPCYAPEGFFLIKLFPNIFRAYLTYYIIKFARVRVRG